MRPMCARAACAPAGPGECGAPFAGDSTGSATREEDVDRQDLDHALHAPLVPDGSIGR